MTMRDIRSLSGSPRGHGANRIGPRRVGITAVVVLGMVLGLLAAGCQAPASKDGQALSSGDLVFGPYTSAVSPHGASVHWISPAGVEGSCRLLGGSSAAKVEVVTARIAGRSDVRHTALVTGLEADRQHWYEVTAGRDRAEGSLRTPPAAGSRKPFRFVITGDTQSYPLRIRTVAEAIAEEAPAFVVHTGDLCNNTGNWGQLEAQFFEPWRELLRKAPVWPARGNHEYGVEPFASLFGLPPMRLWYSFDYDNLHVVVLDQWEVEDSEDMEPERMRAMAEWLDRDLAAARGKADWILVAGHQQMFNVAGHGSTWGHEEILPLLYRHGVDLVVSGHSHLYERFVPIGPPGAKPIHFIVSGGGGAPNYESVPSPILVKSIAVPHYSLYHVDGERLELTIKNSGGTVLDRVVLTKTRGELSPNIVEAAIPPEDAKRLLKVYKGLQADVAEHPRGGRAMVFRLRTDRIPGGSRVHIATDPGSAWAAEETTFDVVLPEEGQGKPPASLTLTPPAGVLLTQGQLFSPEPTVAVTLEYNGRTWFNPSVPIALGVDSLLRLVPPPEPVDVAAGPAVVVDGNLAEWASVPLLHLPSVKGPGRSLKLAWRPDGLYGAVVAEQDGIHVDAALPWNADSLEVSLEADARRRLRMTSRGTPVKFFLWPDAAADSGRASYRRMTGRLSGREVRSAWRRTPTGYTMEFRISARALTPGTTSSRRPDDGDDDSGSETPLVAGRAIGLDLILRHDGVVVEQFADTAAFRSTWSSPVYWGRIRLSGE